MKPEIISEAIGMIDDDIIEAADKARAEPPRKKSRAPLWISFGSMAACAAIIASVAITNISDKDSIPTVGMQTEESTLQADDAGVVSSETEEDIIVEDAVVETADGIDGTYDADDENPGVVGDWVDGTSECVDDALLETAEELVTDEITDNPETGGENGSAVTLEAAETETAEGVDETGDVIMETVECLETTELSVITGEAVDESQESAVVETEEVTGEAVDETMECVESCENDEVIDETSEGDDNPSSGGNTEPVKGYFDGAFIAAGANPSTGAPVDYDGLVEMITNPQSGGLDSYYLFYVQRVLTLGECEQLDGFDEAYRSYYPAYSEETTEVGAVDSDSYPSDFIIYEVEMVNDLITGEYIGQIMYIMSTGNSVAYQEYGDPPYSPHEMFAAALMLPIEGTEIRRTTGSFALRYDVLDGMAYSRDNYTMDALNLPDSVVYKETLVTSTTENPARYTQKLPLDSLCGFLREDWKARGISRHFSN